MFTKALAFLTSIIDFVIKLFQLFKLTFENIKHDKRLKWIIPLICIILLSSAGICYVAQYDERVSEETENTYPILPDEIKNHPDTENIEEGLPETIQFDIKEFNYKYYDDSLFKFINALPSTKEDIQKFINNTLDMISGKDVRSSASICDAPKKVHHSLSHASDLDIKDDVLSIKERVESRVSAYDMCHNSAIARLIGHDYYKLFLKAHGTEEKLKYSKLALQYFNRSLMLSADNNTNQSYCAVLLGSIYSALVNDETDIGYKYMLNLRALLCMETARNNYPTEGLNIAPYHEVCFLTAQTYLIMLQLCKKDSPLLKYYYDKAHSLYNESLSDRSVISAEDENRYLKDLRYLETIYNEKACLN